MPSWRKLFVFAAFLPGLAAAADPAMLELIMPDARFVVDINLARLVASPIGQALSAQVKTGIQDLHPDWQQSMASLNGVDWTRFAQEVIFAGRPGKDSPNLVIVRGLLDPAWIESLSAFHGAKSAYLGVPILTAGNGASMVAFLEGSIAVLGRPADVKAAIARRGQNTPRAAVLAEGLDRFEGQYDLWVVSDGPLTAPSKSPTPDSMKWLDRLESLTGAMRFSPDFEISADLAMRNEKDVAEMADGLRWFAGVMQTQARGSSGSLDNMNFKVDGKRLSLSLEVPEKEVRAALQQRQPGQAAPARPAPVRPPDISSGLPDPPSGTIRVQSSPGDMGTAILPVGNGH